MPDLAQVSYLRDEDAEEVCFARGLRRAGAQVLLEAAAGDDLGHQLAECGKKEVGDADVVA
jgi:hypothetical protein